MRVESEPTQSVAYEVRCYRCNTSFAPGTRRCLHCGERLGHPPSPGRASGLPVEAGEEEGSAGSPVRILIWAVSVLLALAGSLFRVCQGG